MPSANSTTENHSALNLSLSSIRGVGPRMLPKLEKLGLKTVEDALYHLPLRYEDRRQLKSISRLHAGQQEVFVGQVLAAGESKTARSRKQIFEIIVGDDSGQISLKWFRYRKPWLQKRFPVGQKAVFIGEVKQYGGTREVYHPDSEPLPEGVDPLRLLENDPLNFGRILPVYPLTDGLSQKQSRKIWFALVADNARFVVSQIPADILQRKQLMPLTAALCQAHWPENHADLNALQQGRDQARSSLVFDEFFYLELGLLLKRQGIQLEVGFAFKVEHRYTIPLNKMLPFKLTEAQRRVLGEIKQDMMAPHPMNRLLQGDVGSGKTLVALMAALVAIENETQVAIVAPTEILAEQHYTTFHQWLEQLGLRSLILQGSMKSPEKKSALGKIAAGEVDLVVGTHAILQEGVEFKRLGLGIVDEQHRFGVKQRSILRHKGCNPDILVMTATPIPRTLSLTLYGDLSISVIDQLPPGRKPVTTQIFNTRQRTKAYAHIHHELEQGRQAYIVYPLVEESEKSDLQAATEAADYLADEVFPQARIGLLHGRMKATEKDLVMSAFRRNQLDLLVATTVIVSLEGAIAHNVVKVGVDLPDLYHVLIISPERYGLVTLHQLRGQVARKGGVGYCDLLLTHDISPKSKQRLEAFKNETDGFKLARIDMRTRGVGDLDGDKRSGHDESFLFGRSIDIDIFDEMVKTVI